MTPQDDARKKALDAVERLANTKMELSLIEWSEISNAILDAINQPAPVGGDEHCKDCCCAESWKALGISEYTGKSIPEHIADLRALSSPQAVVNDDRLRVVVRDMARAINCVLADQDNMILLKYVLENYAGDIAACGGE